MQVKDFNDIIDAYHNIDFSYGAIVAEKPVNKILEAFYTIAKRQHPRFSVSKFEDCLFRYAKIRRMSQIED